jgi:tetratricopeptide (TPR) repeat protein
MTHRRCLPALLVALLLAAPAAGAAPPSDDATSAQIAALYKRANALYGQKDLAGAEALYLEAWRLKRTYDVACNFGAVELDLGKPRDAAEYLAFALREFPAGERAAAREQIKTRLALARAEVGTLHVRVNVPGAVVSVGDRAVGKAPVDDELFVSPGTIAVSASAPGYEQALQSVQVAKGGSADVVLTLKEPRRSLVPAFVMGGVGAAALIGGAAFIGVAQAKKSTAQTLATQTNHGCPLSTASQQGRCKDLESAAASADTFGNAGIGLLVTAGIAAAGVATYLLWPSSHAASVSGRVVRVVPVAGLGGGGVTVVGAF